MYVLSLKGKVPAVTYKSPCNQVFYFSFYSSHIIVFDLYQWQMGFSLCIFLFFFFLLPEAFPLKESVWVTVSVPFAGFYFTCVNFSERLSMTSSSKNEHSYPGSICTLFLLACLTYVCMYVCMQAFIYILNYCFNQ